MGDQAEGLVGDRRQAHVGDPPHAVAEDGRDRLLEVVDVGHQRVDDDDELGALLDRDVDVGGRADAAVDQLAPLEVDRLVDDRQAGRALDRLGDRHVGPALLAEDDPLAGVEVGRGQVELAVEQAEVVDAAGRRRALPRRSRRGRSRSRDRSAAPRRGRRRCRSPRTRRSAPARAAARAVRSGSAAAFCEEAEVVGLQHLVEVEVLELGGDPRVEHLHHLVGGDAVGEHPGDEGAGAGADVDVEVVDGAVDREQVERAQGADLVDAAGEAAAAEDQSRLRGLFAAARFTAGLGLDVDDFAHQEHGVSQEGRRPARATGEPLPWLALGVGIAR